jgi:hypothetical protein
VPFFTDPLAVLIEARRNPSPRGHLGMQTYIEDGISTVARSGRPADAEASR